MCSTTARKLLASIVAGCSLLGGVGNVSADDRDDEFDDLREYYEELEEEREERWEDYYEDWEDAWEDRWEGRRRYYRPGHRRYFYPPRYHRWPLHPLYHDHGYDAHPRFYFRHGRHGGAVHWGPIHLHWRH